jgi:hypothetical protein
MILINLIKQNTQKNSINALRQWAHIITVVTFIQKGTNDIAAGLRY